MCVLLPSSGRTAVYWRNIGAAPQFFLIRQVQLRSVITSNSILLLNSVSELAQPHQRVSSILQRVCSTLPASQLNSAASLVNSTASLLNSVSGFLFHSAYFVKSPVRGSFHFCILCEESRQLVISFCILCEEFRYFVLCTLFNNVLCILYQESMLLC